MKQSALKDEKPKSEDAILGYKIDLETDKVTENNTKTDNNTNTNNNTQTNG